MGITDVMENADECTQNDKNFMNEKFISSKVLSSAQGYFKSKKDVVAVNVTQSFIGGCFC